MKGGVKMGDLRFPIGEFKTPNMITEDTIRIWIDELEKIPQQLQEAIEGLSPEQLDTAYRPGGWTVRQVVHHLTDGNINAYIRFKLALTEEEPTIKPFYEERWADLPDSTTLSPEISLSLLQGLHKRWIFLLRSLKLENFQRKFIHPEGGITKLDVSLGRFVWHGKHHIAHITSLRKRNNW